MCRSHAIVRWGLVVATLLLAPSLKARAESVETLLREGVELRRQGRDDEALELFRRAHAAAPTPRTSAQVALAAQAVGRWVEAEAGLAEALASPDDPWIARNEHALRTALERVQGELGTLTVETPAAGATIRVNGGAVGTAPLETSLRVKAGVTTVEVVVGDRVLAARDVVVPARGAITATLDTERVTAATPPPAEPKPAPVSIVRAALPAPVAVETRPSITRQSSSPPRWVGWSLAAAAGGLLATGVVAHVVRNDSAAHYNDDARCFYGEQTRDQRCGNVRDRFETAQAVAIVGYALGAAALGGALVVLLWPEQQARGHVACIDAQLSERGAHVSASVPF